MVEESAKLMNRQQVAAMLGVCEDTISRWRKANKFPCPIIYTGRSQYWSESQIKKWLDKESIATTSDNKP